MPRLSLLLLFVLAPAVLLLQLPAGALATRRSPALLQPRTASLRSAAFAIHCNAAESEGEEGAAAASAETGEAADGADAAAAADPKAALKAEKQELRDAIANLEAQLIKARGEASAAQEQAKGAGEGGYLLLAADFERFRLKAKDELSTQKGFGKVAAVRSLLPFTETFEALQAERDGDEGESAIHKYYGGIWKQYQQLLESWKVEPFGVNPGDTFDFKRHQVVESVATEEAPKDTILEVIERGWEMDGETVRLAKVKVSSGPPAAEEPPPAEEETAAAEEA